MVLVVKCSSKSMKDVVDTTLELSRQCNEKRVSYSLVTVTELTATGVMVTARGQTLSSVCDFTYFWIRRLKVSHNMFLLVRDLENMN